jgi:hypothetical protein
LFVNGTQLGSTYTSDTNTYSSTGPTIGWNSGGNHLNGYVSNLRILSGTALYTASFTPPTTPLTSVTNTSLLTCQSNRFVDNSSNNFAITRNGDVRVTAWSPFAPTSAYDPATNGGSGYFDGSGDELRIANNTALQLGGSDFTIEGWVYFTDVSSARRVFTKGLAATSDVEYALGIESSQLRLTYSTNGTSLSVLVTSGLTAADWLFRWNHIAVVRNGNDLRLYLNGVSVKSTTFSSSLNTSTSAQLVIGSNGNSASFAVGYFSDLRIVKGTAVYTSAFTPPTAPLTAITNTSLLLNFTNAGIFDNAAKNVIETVGNAQLSTSVTKFGTGSMYFDGSGDRGQISNASGNTHLIVGTADCTIEAWIYLIGSGSEGLSPNFGMIYGKTSVNGGAANFFNEVFYTNATNRTVTFNANTADGQTQVNVTTPNNSISLNTWHHVAFVKSGTTWTIYVDGVNRVSATRQQFGTTTAFVAAVGRNANSSSYMFPFNGYIDDLRVTNGLARYTADFTPPTAPYPDL